jgi:Cdc6-like AAA superfamily ATPase
MIETMQLKDLLVGKTDAKNELSESTNAEKARFIDSFLIPDNIQIEDFLKGRKYFVTGFKGTGKTALLRYIGISLEKSNDVKSSFILFKTEFTQEDKSAFSKAANTFLTIKNDDHETEEDFVNIWQWFLHRHIVKISAASLNIFFENDNNWEKYSKCVSAPKLSNEESGIIRLMPKLKKGNVEIEGDFEFFKGSLGLEFDWENEAGRQVKFSNLVRQADELFKKLKPRTSKLFIFLDELELTLGKQKQYQKDIRLIRDLIIAVNNINTLCRKLKFNLYLITAIRSEVITAIHSAGKEINKPILDFGVSLKWQQSGGNLKEHPLIKIINKKIQSTERALSIKVSTDEEVWEKYFYPQVNTSPTYEYILHRTWFRPRDIVRLLNIAQQQFPYETKFSHQVFDSIVKEYSTQSWVELTEELRATFSESEVDGIKKMLTALKCPFTLHQLRVDCDEKIKYYTDLDNLLKKYKIGDILSHLYKIGAIGNTGEKIRFSFRGDDELVVENKMKIHDALWNYLSIEPRP